MKANHRPIPDDARAAATAIAAAPIARHFDDNASPPALLDEAASKIIIDDNEDEEEIVSLGLSVNSNTVSEADRDFSAVSTVGANRKSAFPATPATPTTALNYSRSQLLHGGKNSGGYGPPIPVRRTPGPMNVNVQAHQARHRRTPGAGQDANNVSASFCQPLPSGWMDEIIPAIETRSCFSLLI